MKATAPLQTVDTLAESKRLNPAWLRGHLGLGDLPGGGVSIPYYDLAGEEMFVRQRDVPGAAFRQPKGVALQPYGLWKLDVARRDRLLYLVEGESDCWALWACGLPAIGIPGANATASCITAECIDSIDTIHVWQEPDQAGKVFVEGVRKQLLRLGYKGHASILSMDGTKDPSELFASQSNRKEFSEELARIVKAARPLITPTRTAETNGRFHAEAKPASEPWDRPIPLSCLPDAPPFPVNIFPPWLSHFVMAEARATQTPPDVAGMLALGFCGAALAKKFRVLARPGWTEPTNVYVVGVLPPGNRKSAVFADMVKPVQEHERRELDRARPALAADESDRQIIEGRLKSAIAEAAKAKEGEQAQAEEKARELSRQLSRLSVTRPPLVYVDDTTPEKLAGILADQGGRLLVTSAEGTIFEIAKGRYADSPNFDVFLKAHSGDSIRVHRIGREPDCVDDPALTLAVVVQPSVISELADHSSLRGRGFIARFLFAVPVSLLGKRKPAQPPVPASLAREYHRRILAMWELPGDTGDDFLPRPRFLELAPAAEAVLRSFEEWLEPQLGEDGELHYLADWASKLAGAALRIAGILHVAGQVCDGAVHGPIERQTVELAITFASEYLLPHAKIAHALLGSDERLQPAKKVLQWLKRREKREPFSRRDVYRALHSDFKRAEDVDPALEMLDRNGWVRPVDQGENRGRGRPASQTYEVNPALIDTPSDR